MKKVSKISICAFSFALGMLGLPHTTSRAAQNDTILPNIYVGNTNVGGMTKDQAKQACQSYIDEINNTKIVLKCNDETANVTFSELGIMADPDVVCEAACEYGRKGNVLKRYKETKSLENGGEKKLELEVSLSEDAYGKVEAMIAPFNKEAANAGIEMVDGSFQVKEETVGIACDVQATVDAIKGELAGANGGEISVDVVKQEVKPEVTSEALKDVKDELGSFSTNYSGDAGRMANVENATNFINGTVLMPGEEFDTDATIRPYTEENGYHYAGEYNNGKVVQGLGGGICQVSTTLYNAVLYAELEVTQRSNHSLTVGYVKLAKDAAIAGDIKNFKFKNSSDSPIYIAGACVDGEVTFSIFGKETRPANRTLDFESVLVNTINPGEPIVEVDNSLPPGTRNVTQNAHTGYVAELYKHVYIDGELTETVKINTSTYNATPEYVTVGPDAPPEQPAPEQPAEGGEQNPEQPPAEGGEGQNSENPPTEGGEGADPNAPADGGE